MMKRGNMGPMVWVLGCIVIICLILPSCSGEGTSSQLVQNQVVVFSGQIPYGDGNVSIRTDSGVMYQIPAMTPAGIIQALAGTGMIEGYHLGDELLAKRGIFTLNGINSYQVSDLDAWFVLVNGVQLREYLLPSREGLNTFLLKDGDDVLYAFGDPTLPPSAAKALIWVQVGSKNGVMQLVSPSAAMGQYLVSQVSLPLTVPTAAPVIVASTPVPAVEVTVAPLAVPPVDPVVNVTAIPTPAPTVVPTVEVTVAPPVVQPVVQSVNVTVVPTPAPTVVPTVEVTVAPPVVQPVVQSVNVTVVPTPVPTVVPTVEVTVAPPAVPPVDPVVNVTVVPTPVPTVVPTVEVTVAPTPAPTVDQSVIMTDVPTPASTPVPTVAPTAEVFAVPAPTQSAEPDQNLSMNNTTNQDASGIEPVSTTQKPEDNRILYSGVYALPEGTVNLTVNSGRDYEIPVNTPLGLLYLLLQEKLINNLSIDDRGMRKGGILILEGINEFFTTAKKTWFVKVNGNLLQDYVDPKTDGLNLYSLLAGDTIGFYYGDPAGSLQDADAMIIVTLG